MYEEIAEYSKVLSDKNRLKILDMLSCGEFTNKEMLEFLDISQPTLSHHLKNLTKFSIVNKKRNKNSYIYSLNNELINEMNIEIMRICSCKETCECMQRDRNVQ